MEKKDNNEDKGRVKRKEEYLRRWAREVVGGKGDGVTWGDDDEWKRGKKEEEEEAEAGNLDRVDHPLKPRALAVADPAPVPPSLKSGSYSI